jgi:hypothetical protein
MSSRKSRRRGETQPIIGRTELVAALVVFAAAALTLVMVFLISSGGDGDDDSGGSVAGSDVPATATGAAFMAEDEAGAAILELGRRSVEALPNGQWPGLYDSFTQEFRDRCPREEFEAAGETDAEAQGDRLQQIAFVKMLNVVFSGDTATAVIVGAVGSEEYTIGTGYALEDGEWKIAPPPDTSGCNGFTRLG